MHPPPYRERSADQHFAQPALLCLEQTHNRLGGRVLSLDYMRAAAAWAAERGLSVHCDGARVFNAAARLGVGVDEIAQHVTTCAPVKSLASWSAGAKHLEQ